MEIVRLAPDWWGMFDCSSGCSDLGDVMTWEVFLWCYHFKPSFPSDILSPCDDVLTCSNTSSASNMVRDPYSWSWRTESFTDISNVVMCHLVWMHQKEMKGGGGGHFTTYRLWHLLRQVFHCMWMCLCITSIFTFYLLRVKKRKYNHYYRRANPTTIIMTRF